ncbi:MAG: hypothetical protein AAF236_14660 [Verrucomicrobiota bacterium]
MQALLFHNLTNRGVSDSLEGNGFFFPELVEGDDLVLGFRFAERIGNENVEADRTVSSMRAVLGRVDQTPVSGDFALTVDGETTADLSYPITAATLETALQGLAITDAAELTVRELGGSLVIDAPNQLTIEVAKNCLEPISFIRQREWQCEDSGGWHHELRFQESPVALSTSWSPVVPPPPRVEEVVKGSSTDFQVFPEIQHLHVPGTFRGTFRLKRGGSLFSDHLSVENTPEEIAEAIKPLADEGGIFTVALAFTGVVSIAFGGTMAGSAQALLEVEIVAAPPGDPTIALDLNTAELAALFRSSDKIKLPLEIDAEIEDPQDASLLRTTTLLRTEVTVLEQLSRDGDAEAQRIDWLRPPLPIDYVPFTADQVITGSQHFPFELSADGVVDHNLETAALHITVVDKASGLILKDDLFAATIDNDNSVDFVFDAAVTFPVVGVISTAGPISAFQAHTHTIAQVVGLTDALNELGDRLGDLESRFIFGPISRRDEDADEYSRRRAIPPFGEIYPIVGRFQAELAKSAPLSEFDQSQLPQVAPELFTAVHDDVISPIPTISVNGRLRPARPSSEDIGGVFENQTSSDLFLVSLTGFNLKPGQFAATNGRVWYPVSRYDNAESSFYPTEYERTLFSEVIEAEELTENRIYSIRVQLELAAFRANTAIYTHFVFETGQLIADTSPGTPGGNLADVDWNPVPVLSQSLTLTASPLTTVFGFRVENDEETLKAEQLRFGSWSPTTAPLALPFAIRGRMIRVDPENDVATPSGFIALSGPLIASAENQSGLQQDGVGVSIVS